jgi:hypothetical protein
MIMQQDPLELKQFFTQLKKSFVKSSWRMC